MLTLEDCIGLSELTELEVDAIAEHEHLPQIVAAELGRYLVEDAQGQRTICTMIRDDIAASQARGDFMHSAKLKLALKAFLATHPSVVGPDLAGTEIPDSVRHGER